MRTLSAIFVALLTICTPAAAQWQTPNHSVPLGRGAGMAGFGNAAPGVAGQALLSNGASVDPTFQVPPLFSAGAPGYVPAAGGASTSLFLNQAGGFTAPAGSGGSTAPTTQIFLTGSGTYTTRVSPPVAWLEIRLVGGASGGGGGNQSTLSTAGGDTCWNTSGAACTSPVFKAAGAAGSSYIVPGAPGTNVGGTSWPGGGGSAGAGGAAAHTAGAGGLGGSSCLGGAGSGSNQGSGTAGAANSGSGGGGGAVTSAVDSFGGSGGTAGGCVIGQVNSPAATYTYAVGPGGAGATGGTSGFAGASGANGILIVIEH